MSIKLYVGNLTSKTEDGAILTSKVREFKRFVSSFMGNEEASKEIEFYFTEILESRKRVRKTQTEINRLKKKTQAILDKLR